MWGDGLSHIPHIDMTCNHIEMQDYLKEIADKPDSDSVFKRIEHASLDLIKKAFELHIRNLFHKTGDFFKRGKVRDCLKRIITIHFF